MQTLTTTTTTSSEMQKGNKRKRAGRPGRTGVKIRAYTVIFAIRNVNGLAKSQSYINESLATADTKPTVIVLTEIMTQEPHRWEIEGYRTLHEVPSTREGGRSEGGMVVLVLREFNGPIQIFPKKGVPRDCRIIITGDKRTGPATVTVVFYR